MYERILVPTDGSSGVERAITHAVELAAAHDATVHAIYVVNTASFASMPMESSWEGVSDMLRREGEAALDRVREIGESHGVAVETALADGAPSREIVRYAEREHCDLVVMGTHGRGGIDRLLLGSVAERVVRSSNVPVLTVRVGSQEEVEDADSEETEVGDAGPEEAGTDETGTEKSADEDAEPEASVE